MVSSQNRVVLEVAVVALVALPACARAAGSTDPAANAIAQSQLQQRWPGAEAPSMLVRQGNAPWMVGGTSSLERIGGETSSTGTRPHSIFSESPFLPRELTGCVPFHRHTGTGFNCRFKFFGP